MHTKKLEVKCFWSPDIDNLWAWGPEKNEVFYLLQMSIGFAGEDAADDYSIIIATPEGIMNEFKKRSSDEIYKIIVQKEYSWKNVVAHINYLISTIDSWNQYEINSFLQGYFHWEYGKYSSLLGR